MSIIKALKYLSQRLGSYNAIRYSKIYFWILKYKNPDYIKALDEDLAFYRVALGDSLGLVFDVGANHGDKTWAFRQIAKKIVSFEPDKKSFSALRSRYGLDKSICLENIALGELAGVAEFFVEEEGSAYNTLSEKERDWLISTNQSNIRKVIVPISTLDKMIVKYGVPDFLKIDVEGGEQSVFKGLSYPISVICFEANLPRFKEETIGIINRFLSNKSARFNLRLGNNFIFSSHQSAEEIITKLSSNEEVSYDIFIFNELNAQRLNESGEIVGL
jgi:FkbM family methyltransferase